MIKKLYYSIGEVTKIVDIKPHVLRYWESEFSILSPSKNRAGNRVYREKDILLVKFIKNLLYKKKFTIEGAKQKLKDIKKEELTKFEQNENQENTSKKSEKEKYGETMTKLKHGLKDILELLNTWES